MQIRGFQQAHIHAESPNSLPPVGEVAKAVLIPNVLITA